MAFESMTLILDLGNEMVISDHTANRGNPATAGLKPNGINCISEV